MTKIMMTGCSGQLMNDILRVLVNEQAVTKALDRSELDVTNAKDLEKEIADFMPDVIIQGASVHSAENIEKDPSEALSVNLLSLMNMRNIFNELKIHPTIVNFSTNYVFDGLKASSKAYDEDDSVDPVCYYGFTKKISEQFLSAFYPNHLNIRTAGLFGVKGSRAKNGTNFVYKVLENIESNKEMKVVDDQLMNVTYTLDLAKVTVDIIFRLLDNKIAFGTFHITNEGTCSWFEVAKFIATIYKKEHLIIRSHSGDFYANFKRPLFTQMESQRLKLYGISLTNWRDAVIRFLIEINKL